MTGLQANQQEYKNLQNHSINRSEDYYRSGLLLIDSGEYELAKKLFSQTLRLNSYHAGAIRWMAYCFEQQDNQAAALQTYKSLTKVAPSEEHWFLLAQFCNKTLHPSAKEYYLKSLQYTEEESPYLFEIYKNLGNISLREGDAEAAEEYYNRAYIIRPDSDVLNVNYGVLEIQRNNFIAAGEKFRQAISKNSKNDAAWVGLALVHRNTIDSQLSWANIKRALDINPKNLMALQICVDWALADECYDYAIEPLQKYLHFHPEDAIRNLLLASLLFKQKNWNACRWELEKILAFDPHLQGALVLMEQLKLEQA